MCRQKKKKIQEQKEHVSQSDRNRRSAVSAVPVPAAVLGWSRHMFLQQESGPFPGPPESGKSL